MRTHHDAIHVQPGYEGVLADARVDTVAGVLSCAGDRLAAWSRTTDTIHVGVNGDERQRGELFIKRYYYPSWKRRIKAMLRGTFLGHSRARVEYDSLMLLTSRGVPTVRPVAHGERRTWHLLRHCFLITEGVDGATSLVNFALLHAAGGPSELSFSQRRRLIVTLAERIRHMHEAGLVHGHLFWRNILVRPATPDEYEFFFLDAGVTRRIRWGGGLRHPAALQDIAQLTAIATQFCSRTELCRFARAYLGTGRSRDAVRRWTATVTAQARRFERHEAYRLKVEQLFNRHVRDGVGSDPH